MTLFNRSRSFPPASDHVPEEDDALVGALRQAYASTPVPDNLVARIQDAVRTSSLDSVSESPTKRPALKLGFVAAPALAVAAVVLVLMHGFGGSSANPPSHPFAAAAVVWTNAP